MGEDEDSQDFAQITEKVFFGIAIFFAVIFPLLMGILGRDRICKFLSFILCCKVCQNTNQRQETVQEAAATENTPLIA
eukprot:04135.XXX_66574_66972_1 [CDS] Oithona nana genome sequencing.